MLDKIEKIVNEYPTLEAYIFNDEKITYRELWNSSIKYSDYLKRQGNSPVIIYGNKECNMMISILSCVMANRTYVPIGLFTPLDRIKKIINNTKSTLILSDYNLELDDIDICNLNGLDKYSNNSIADNNNEYVYMIFTSGSTGDPKGVPISKTNLNNFIEWISSLKPLNSYKNINVLNQANFSFDLSVADIYYSLCNGHTLYGLDLTKDYTNTYKVFKNIDVAVMTPTFMKLCLLDESFNTNNYPKFKCVYFCGEQLEVKLAKKILDRFPNLNIINAYGPTEATSAVSAHNITLDDLNKSILPVGDIDKCATNVSIEDNEIILKGDSVFSGYLGNIEGGHYKEEDIDCYKTGDLGFIKDKMLYCKERKDNQIKYKGYRIELSEIEYNINQINGVDDCVVVASYNDDHIVKNIKAFIIGKDITISYIKEELLKSLPSYMIPTVIKIVDVLPVNQNVKIDRKALSNI